MIYNVNQAQPYTGFRSEEQILRNKCSMINAQVSESFSRFGGQNSSAYKNAITTSITNYLERIGTPTAEKLLIEYQRCNFNNIC